MERVNNLTATIKKKKTIKFFFREYTVPYLMLAPNFILFCVFVLYPLLWSLRFMFYDYDGITTAVFSGLDNFTRAFTRDPIWWRAVLNTIVFTGGKLIIEIPLAIVLAVILNGKIRGKNFLRAAFFLPNVTSAAVMGMVFMFMFSPYNGYINGVLTNMGLITENVNWLAEPALAMLSCILVSVWQNFGQNMLLALAGLQNVPAELYESASVDGANKFQCFF
ncbi:MAG: sugar ABC transporter permease, partial [Oscillospiraceae bacterium]